MTDSKTGPELLSEVAEEVTLDRFLDRDPYAVPYTDQELINRVKVLRNERVQFQLKSDARRAKRQGVEEVTDPTKSDDEESNDE